MKLINPWKNNNLEESFSKVNSLKLLINSKKISSLRLIKLIDFLFFFNNKLYKKF